MRSRMAWAMGTALALTLAQASVAQRNLDAGFKNPPASARPHTWWHWCNGNISKAGITADLEAMKKVGIGGAQLFHVDVGLPAGPVPYLSPQWREMVKHAAKEANRLGIELCMHNCAGWSSSGGPWVTPEHAMQVLTWTETKANGGARFAGTLPQPENRLGYYRDIAVLAFRVPEAEANGGAGVRLANIRGKACFDRSDRILPDTSPTPPGTAIPKSGVLDLTAKMDANGRLTWDAPEGAWVVLRLGHTPTGSVNAPAPPEGRGPECDKLSREALDTHWNGIMAKVIADLGPLAGKVLNNSLIDSYEVGSQNWTPKFREEFRKRRGYDLTPFLPTITGRVVESIEQSERFLWDFRRTIADLYADNYFGYFGDRCRQHGMQFSTEPYGNGPFDNLQAGGRADIVMGEFWVGGAAAETTKLAASAAHTNGRKIVGAESFTADDRNGRWRVDPYSIKALGDFIFCQGVNRYIFHRYAHQPWKDLKPGLTMGPWGMHLERTVTWWNQAHEWLRYVARCQYLLQSGKFAADACYFVGEEAPNDLPGRRGLRPEIPEGYDYDGCDASVVLNRMSVKDGRIVLPDGMTYRVLVLPDSLFMTPAVARKIRDLVRDGATVVGPKPRQSPSLTSYPACDAEVQQIVNEVWGDSNGTTITSHTFGKGNVFWNVPLKTVLGQMSVLPDFEVGRPLGATGLAARLAYIHRQIEGAEVYFVSNQRYHSEMVKGTFRVSGKIPELWYPDSGKIETAPVYRDDVGRTTVDLRLDPAGSVFVVFRNPRGNANPLVDVIYSGPPLPQLSVPRIEIVNAFYEPTNGRPGADVTAKVKELVSQGEYLISASNDVFGDPTPNVVKQLRVEYLVDGKKMQKTVGENETLELAGVAEETGLLLDELTVNQAGQVELIPWQGAPSISYSVFTARERVATISPAPSQKLDLPDNWMLRFPSGQGAPGQVFLNRLISWTEINDPGARYFSGTAEYSEEFDVPAEMLGENRALRLDLGRVKNFAEVELNGRKLNVLWKAPFRLDVAGIVRPGKNVLKIRVTNLWPNRLIGDEQLPPEVEWNGPALKAWPEWVWNGKPRPKTERHTFTTWHFYDKNSPLLESGLLGPVTLWSAQKAILK